MSIPQLNNEHGAGEQIEDPHALRARGLLNQPTPVFWYCPDCGQITFDPQACCYPFCGQVVDLATTVRRFQC